MKNVTTKNLLTIALATALALPAASFAKSNNDVPNAGQTAGHHKRGGRGGLMNHAAEELGLSPAQKAQMQALRKEFAPQRKALRDNKSLTPAQRKAQTKALNASYEARVNAILTPEQRTKLAAIIAQRRQERRERRQEKRETGQKMAPATR